jgi:CTP:molybdopterin cytidylyltransferase MocA
VSGVDAVVVAAGASTRMGGAGSRAGGRPVLAWTLAALAAAPSSGASSS